MHILHAYMNLYAPCLCRSPQTPEDTGSPGTEVTGVCDLPDVGASNQTWVYLQEQLGALNH